MREAILLVGGQGTRLRPLTINTPKPMLPVAGVPFTVHQILRARDAGVTRIVLATSYRADVFADFLSNSELGAADSGIDIVIATEDEPLGTGGAIRYASSFLTSAPTDSVIVFNGDVLTGLDINALVHHHEQTNSDVTLYLTKVSDPRAYGLVPTDPTGRVLQFLEKPQTPEEIVTDQINAGCYVFTRSVIDQIPPGRPVSVERETFPELLAQSRLVSGVVDQGYWLDLGTPLAFVQGSVDLVRGSAPSPAVIAPGESLILAGAIVDPTAVISDGTTLGVNARVGVDSIVSGSVVFAGAAIGDHCVIRNSIIGEGAVIADHCIIDGSVIGDHSQVGAHNELREGVRVWVDSVIPELSVRFSSDQ
jgi:mannose-1-phosphate guanylyltransferase